MHGLLSVFLTFPLDFARTGDERAGRERGTAMLRQERASSRQVVVLLTSIISHLSCCTRVTLTVDHEEKQKEEKHEVEDEYEHCLPALLGRNLVLPCRARLVRHAICVEPTSAGPLLVGAATHWALLSQLAGRAGGRPHPRTPCTLAGNSLQWLLLTKFLPGTQIISDYRCVHRGAWRHSEGPEAGWPLTRTCPHSEKGNTLAFEQQKLKFLGLSYYQFDHYPPP